MKKKVFIIIWIKFLIILLVGVAIIGGLLAFFSNNVEEIVTNVPEYIPEAEITDEELRKTIVTLYFLDSETNKLSSEARLIDSKELLRDTYKVLLKMLIEGPKDNNLESLIPENTEIIDTKLKGDCLVINFSKEFLEIDKTDSVKVSNLIYSIVNTLTELKEITKVKFLIDGEESDVFSDIGIDLKVEFIRND